MASKKSAMVEHWTVSDAVTWIAFRTEPEAAPHTIIAEPGTARFMSPEIMGALLARAEGNPKGWPKPGEVVRTPRWPAGYSEDFPPHRVRIIVKRWIRETQLDGPELLSHAYAEQRRYARELVEQSKQQSQYKIALNELNVAAASGQISVRGRPCIRRELPQSPPLRVLIPSTYFDEPRRIDLSGRFGIRDDEEGCGWIHDPGPFFYDVQLSAVDVRKRWPKQRPTKLPPPPQGMLKSWWKNYVVEHNDPDTHPTAEEQKLAATEYFGAQGFSAPSDGRLKGLRANAPTPMHWSEKGRLPKIGR